MKSTLSNVRKYIIGSVFGFLLSLSVTAYGEEITTLVGKVIQGEFKVTVDGEVLNNKAIVVDGTSYLPVREFAEKLGYEVGFDPKEGVILKKMIVTKRNFVGPQIITDMTMDEVAEKIKKGELPPGAYIFPKEDEQKQEQKQEEIPLEKNLEYIESQISMWEVQVISLINSIQFNKERGLDTTKYEDDLKEAEAQLEKYKKLKEELEAEQKTEGQE